MPLQVTGRCVVDLVVVEQLCCPWLMVARRVIVPA